MKEIYIRHIAGLLQLKDWQVENCVEMFADGDTIPFISRYRKEKTGGMDDAQVAEVRHWADVFDEMEKRKETVLKTIDEAGALTDELRGRIEACVSATELEDLYLPWRPKRRTRATAAREKGLEPLADAIWNAVAADPATEAAAFVGDKVGSAEEALSGARDIIAERLNETAEIRDGLRKVFRSRRICSSVTKTGRETPEASKYRSYFNFSMPVGRIPSHNLLAMLRAGNEGYLSISIDADPQRCSEDIYRCWARGRRIASRAAAEEVRKAGEDAFKRLLEPSISGEVIREAKQKADEESIRVFGENLRQLLLSPPVGQKRTMAIDPGFRNGCKIACLDEHGIKAIMSVQQMLDKYHIEAVAIGNGTASRETVEFMKRINLPQGCKVWTVSEDGASIYSASEIARREFPDEDVTVRGAVSIGRRLMDPLAELVKIDPKNLGIGQYQHDVDQNLLKEMLDNTVESCVNSVGVNLNTASPWLLAYIAGIGPSLAENIVATREKKGGFRSRAELMDVPSPAHTRRREPSGQLCGAPGILRHSGQDGGIPRSQHQGARGQRRTLLENPCG